MKIRLNHNSGFTLTEFLMAVVVMGILIASSIPNIRRMLDNNRMQADVSFLTSGFQLARSEGISRNSSVTICPTTDLASCGGTFKDGWLVFEDPNDNRVMDGGEVPIRVGDRTMPPDAERMLNVSALNVEATQAVTFYGQGRSDRAVEFSLCDPEGEVANRSIRVMRTGQISASTSNIPTC